MWQKKRLAILRRKSYCQRLYLKEFGERYRRDGRSIACYVAEHSSYTTDLEIFGDKHCKPMPRKWIAGYMAQRRKDVGIARYQRKVNRNTC